MRICPSCGEENSDRARFCQNCVTPLTEPESPGIVPAVDRVQGRLASLVGG